MSSYLISKGVELFSLGYSTLQNLKLLKFRASFEENDKGAAENAAQSKSRETLMFWALFGLYMGTKSYWEFLLSWFPGYYYLKSIAILLITFPQLRFAKVAFENALVPMVNDVTAHVRAHGGTSEASNTLVHAPFLIIFWLFPFREVLPDVTPIKCTPPTRSPQDYACGKCPGSRASLERESMTTLCTNAESLGSANSEVDESPLPWLGMSSPDLEEAVRSSSLRLSLLTRESKRLSYSEKRDPVSPLLPQPESIFGVDPAQSERSDSLDDADRRRSLDTQMGLLQKLHSLSPSSKGRGSRGLFGMSCRTQPIADGHENTENLVAKEGVGTPVKEDMLSDAVSAGRVSISRRRRALL